MLELRGYARQLMADKLKASEFTSRIIRTLITRIMFVMERPEFSSD